MLSRAAGFSVSIKWKNLSSRIRLSWVQVELVLVWRPSMCLRLRTILIPNGAIISGLSTKSLIRQSPGQFNPSCRVLTSSFQLIKDLKRCPRIQLTPLFYHPTSTYSPQFLTHAITAHFRSWITTNYELHCRNSPYLMCIWTIFGLFKQTYYLFTVRGWPTRKGERKEKTSRGRVCNDVT